MPISQFNELFESWQDNEDLKLEDLRLKTVTLLAIAVMLRPSDIAPQAQKIDNDGNTQKFVMTRDQISFLPTGDCVIVFHGIKNDYKRDGFEVTLRQSAETFEKHYVHAKPPLSFTDDVLQQ